MPWNGYDGHEHVLIENVDLIDISLVTLIQLTGNAPLKLQVKRGFVNFVAKHIHLISTRPFEEWFPNKDLRLTKCVKGRIDSCTQYKIIADGGQPWTTYEVYDLVHVNPVMFDSGKLLVPQVEPSAVQDAILCPAEE